MRGFKKGLGLVVLCLIIFFGCAKKDAVKSIQDEELLRERIMTYWNHKIKQDLDKTYLFEDPLFRKKVNLVNYVKQYGSPAMTYAGFEIMDIKMTDGEKADVRMKTDVRLKVPGAKAFEHDTEVTELWVKMDGEWYHVPKGKKSLNQ